MPDWGIVLIIALVLFLLVGAKKLPEIARSLGKSSNEFKKGLSEGASESEQAGASNDVEKRTEGTSQTSE
jgi:sec-independent protein translocase protein TatA